MKAIGIFLIAILFLAGGGCALIKGKPKPSPPAEEQVLEKIAPEAAKKKSWFPNLFGWMKSKPQPPRALAVNPVGRIFVYNPAGKYAVIESSSVDSLPPGTLLAVIREGAVSAQLKVSPQSRPPFVIADWIAGKPEKDDKVFVVNE